MYFATIMRSFAAVLVILQVLICSGYPATDSGISCALGYYDNDTAIDDEQQLTDLSFKKTNDTSIELNVEFRLYTREHPNGVQIIFRDESSLKNSGFEANRPTRIITHGFNGRGTDRACIGPKDAFLSAEDYNIIIIDWYVYQLGGGSIPNYLKVIKQVKEVGVFVSEMINFLEEHGMNPNNTALIGHSLGAHVVGIASYHAKTKVNHVIGLDPAEPQFKNKAPSERISDKDAVHVEIIHTNGGHCGAAAVLGHYDFYVNGGEKQPGCTRNSCSHSRVYEYYIESIQRVNNFYGRRCMNSKVIEKENCNGEIGFMGGLNRNAILPAYILLKLIKNLRSLWVIQAQDECLFKKAW